MRIVVDRERCIGAGMCALTAPDRFDQDTEDGKVLLLHPTPPPAHHAATRQAARACPAGAITILDR